MDSEDNERKADQNAKKLIESGGVSLAAYLLDDFKKQIDSKPQGESEMGDKPTISDKKDALINKGNEALQKKITRKLTEIFGGTKYSISFADNDSTELNSFRKRVRQLIKPFFDKYDANRNKTIDEYELQKVLDDIGLDKQYVNPY